MKHCLQVVFMVMLAGCSTDTETSAPAPVVDMERARETLKVSAEEMLTASRDLDTERMLELTHPRLIEVVGGSEEYIAMVQSMAEDLQNEGFSVTQFTVVGENQLAAVGSTVYAIIPHEIQMNGPWMSRGLTSTYLIGISEDAGETWTFVGGETTSGDRERLNLLLPDFPHALLELPPASDPQWGSILNPPESNSPESD